MKRCTITVRAPVLAHGLDDHVAVRVVGADAEDRRAAHAVERLHDRVAVRVDERVDPRRVARHERRRDELAELRDRDLLVVVADRARPVEDARALALGGLEQVRRVHVLHVERRVLAHQHRREIA